MAAKQNQPKGTCSCSQKMDRRDFLKVTAVAGLLAGCSPVVETPEPTREPAAAPKPTLAPGEKRVPDLAGKKAVYILPRRVYAEGCHESSAAALKACGVSITLAAIEKKEVPGFGAGAPILIPDKLLSEIKAEDYDAVIFECGQPQETFNPDLQNLARETTAHNKVLAGICMMPALLAAAGVLKGRQATSNINDQYILEQFEAVLSESDPVRDGKIVTASFEGAEKFGWLIAEAMEE